MNPWECSCISADPSKWGTNLDRCALVTRDRPTPPCVQEGFFDQKDQNRPQWLIVAIMVGGILAIAGMFAMIAEMAK